MNSAQRNTAIEKIRGYYFPLPAQESGFCGGLEAAFNRAKDECMRNLLARNPTLCTAVGSVTFAQFCQPMQPATDTEPRQFEFAIVHRATGAHDQVRATAINAQAAYQAVRAYYSDAFEVAELPCNIRPAHYVLGEINCM
jgi:hypothetical protein